MSDSRFEMEYWKSPMSTRRQISQIPLPSHWLRHYSCRFETCWFRNLWLMPLQLCFVALLPSAELASSLHAKFLIDINARLVFVNTGQTRPFRQGVLATPLWTSNSRITWEFSWRVQHASKLLAFFLSASFQIFLLIFAFQLLYFEICTSTFVFEILHFETNFFKTKLFETKLAFSAAISQLSSLALLEWRGVL